MYKLWITFNPPLGSDVPLLIMTTNHEDSKYIPVEIEAFKRQHQLKATYTLVEVAI